MSGAGAIAGATPFDRAVALAGWLAENGVAGLRVIESTGGWTDLAPRVTDLPGELVGRLEHGSVELVAMDRPLRIVFTPGECLWEGEIDLAGSAPGGSTDTDA